MIHINNFRKEQNSKNRNIYAVNAKINIYIGFSQLWEGLEAKTAPQPLIVNNAFVALYGSVSAGREKWPFNVLFFFKSRASV